MTRWARCIPIVGVLALAPSCRSRAPQRIPASTQPSLEPAGVSLTWTRSYATAVDDAVAVSRSRREIRVFVELALRDALQDQDMMTSSCTSALGALDLQCDAANRAVTERFLGRMQHLVRLWRDLRASVPQTLGNDRLEVRPQQRRRCVAPWRWKRRPSAGCARRALDSLRRRSVRVWAQPWVTNSL